MRMRALYRSNYFTQGPPARRFDNPYFIPSTQVLLQQLVNKGSTPSPAVTNTNSTSGVTTGPVMQPSRTAVPANPDKSTPGATGVPSAEERKPPGKMPTSKSADEIQKKFNKSVADQKARAKAKKDAKELADYLKRDEAERVREEKAKKSKQAPKKAPNTTGNDGGFGKKSGVARPLTDEASKRADAIQKRFNKAVADQKARDKATKDKKAPVKAPAKPAVPKVPSAVAPATPAPTSSPGPAVRDADYVNLNAVDATTLREQVKIREKQKAKYLAEGLKESMLIKNTAKNMRGNRFTAKMLKFRQNQGRINDKIRSANKQINVLLAKAKKDKGTSRRIVPGTGTKGYRSSVGQTNLRGGG